MHKDLLVSGGQIEVKHGIHSATQEAAQEVASETAPSGRYLDLKHFQRRQGPGLLEAEPGQWFHTALLYFYRKGAQVTRSHHTSFAITMCKQNPTSATNDFLLTSS